MAAPRRVLAIAAASGRVAYVFFTGRELIDYGLSKKASRSAVEAAGIVQRWINTMAPEVVVTEKISATFKGDRTKTLIRAVQRTAAHNQVLDVAVTRPRRFDTKYDEAAELITRYPEMKGRLPTWRRFYDTEPRDTVFIDALVLAEQVAGRQEVAQT